MARTKAQAVPRNVSFKDHAGNPGWMCWTSNSGRPTSLPSLSSWVFYMVNPEIKPESFNGHDFKRGLEGLCYDRTHHCRDFHYEFFFLANASADECVAHFRGEMSARGTIWNQIREVAAAKEKQSLRDSDHEVSKDMAAPSLGASHTEPYGDRIGEGQRLPGLMWPMDDPHKIYDRYKGALFLYPHADVNWDGTGASAREIRLVSFDPILIDEEERSGGSVSFDPMDHPVHPSWLPTAPPPNQRHRGIDDELPGECPEEGKSIVVWMEGYAYSDGPPRLEARMATGDATDMGWRSW